MSDDKKIPNPYGRIGGLEHQKEVQNVGKDIKSRGLLPFFEKFIRLFSGKGKFVDVVGLDENSNQIVEIHQIGKQTKDGRPIKREMKTIIELENDTGITPEFHPYNKKENKK